MKRYLSKKYLEHLYFTNKKLPVLFIFYVIFGLTKQILKVMKKYALKPQDFLAFQYNGDVDPLVSTMEANAAGSATTITWKDADKSASFTDANGNSATLMPNDFIKVVSNDDGTFKGYAAVPAATGENDWIEVVE